MGQTALACRQPGPHCMVAEHHQRAAAGSQEPTRRETDRPSHEVCRCFGAHFTGEELVQEAGKAGAQTEDLTLTVSLERSQEVGDKRVWTPQVASSVPAEGSGTEGTLHQHRQSQPCARM